MATASITSPSPRRIFISYARKDGTVAAQTLYSALKNQYNVFLDTANISVGTSWSKEIEAALNACDVLLAILTPASYLSEICRAEQIWALDKCKHVIPVLATAEIDVVPLYLKSRNYRKFPEQQTDLLKDLAAAELIMDPPTTVRPLRYDTIPNLPQNHVIRETALTELRNLVFTEGAGGNIAVTAMAGMGGIGKTVLATALCRDLAVQRAFPDGIAWITIGREFDGDLVTRMREVGRSLGDDLSGYDNPLACEHRYRTILREKAALVVIDNIWNLDHLTPLLVESRRSRFLFTTRDIRIAKAITDRRYSANLLTDSEARHLLSRWSGVNPLPPEAAEIIRECGDLALAISQIGASLSGVSQAEWRDTLYALQHADIGYIKDLLPAGQESFFKSTEVSFQALPEQMQSRYLQLAVLLEDVQAPQLVLQTLWSVNEAEARRTARYFVDRCLALWDGSVHAERGIRLHDLQLDYVRALFKDQAALKLIHEALRLSSHVVAGHPKEFASQIVGRLLPHREITVISEFVGHLTQSAPGAWLKPLWPALHPPGTELVRTLAEHFKSVSGVALTTDGKRAVSASRDKTLKLWDVETGRKLRTFKGHSDYVNGVSVTGDGVLAVSASADKTLKVWDVESGRELRTLEGHSDSVNGVAVTRDGRLAVSASADNTVKVWDVESGRELWTLPGHSSVVLGVALTADGKQAVSASRDKTLKVWDVENGHELRTLAGHSDSVRGVAVTADGGLAVSASADSTLKIWDVESGRELRTLAGHSEPVSGVALTADGKGAVSASEDNTLKVWDVGSGRELGILTGHSESVRGVALTASGKRAVSASDDDTLKVWDVGSGRELRSPAKHSSYVFSVAITSDSKRAVSASEDKTLKVWDVHSRREQFTLTGHFESVHGVALAADGKLAVSASADKTLKVWDVTDGRQLHTLVGHSSVVLGVALTADGKMAISASRDKTLKVWDVESGRELRTLAGHSDSVRAVSLTTDGKRAVSASEDKTLKVWDVESGRELRTLTGHSALINGVALTADGKRAVSASFDSTLKVWDVENGRELHTLAVRTSYVNAVALTPDGNWAVSACFDNTLRVWDLKSAECIAIFHCDGPAFCCAFADELRIFAGDAGGRLYLLSLEGL